MGLGNQNTHCLFLLIQEYNNMLRDVNQMHNIYYIQFIYLLTVSKEYI
jgi:hypothetical protein